MSISTADTVLYWCYIPAKVDLAPGDAVTFYGLPLGGSAYTNTSGSQTGVQVMAGCFVTK